MRNGLVLCLGVALLVVAGCQEQSEPAYTIRNTRKPLSPDGIEAAFSALGLSVESFTCQMPKSGFLKVSKRVYLNGEEQQRQSSSGGIQVGKGLQEMFVFSRTQDGMLNLSLHADGKTIGSGSVSLKPCSPDSARISGWMGPDELLEVEPTPLYFYGANETGRESIGGGTVDVLVSRYGFLVVLFVERD